MIHILWVIIQMLGLILIAVTMICVFTFFILTVGTGATKELLQAYKRDYKVNRTIKVMEKEFDECK